MRHLALLILPFVMACGPKLLDLHVLAANDFRLATDQAIAPLRAFCPSEGTSEDCQRVYAAQHAYVDAHVEFVLRLRQEADANRWRHPDDVYEVRALCDAYRAYAEAVEVIDVQIPALPLGAAALCEEVR